MTETENRAETDLISKKELLQLTGISYGQLYRWKRRGLIPEDWFIRKSAFTGTETFFPRQKALARVAKIQNMKDEEASLGDIADAVSTSPLPDRFALDDTVAKGLVSRAVADLFVEARGPETPLQFADLAALYVVDRLLQSGDAGIEEGRAALATLTDAWPSCEGRECDLVLLRKMGVGVCMVLPASAELHAERAAREVARVPLAESIEQIKTRLR
jgi:hypothetical protein